MYPPKIFIPSDSTELELVEHRVKEKIVKYRYLNGYYFKDKFLKVSEADFEKMVRKNIIKIT